MLVKNFIIFITTIVSCECLKFSSLDIIYKKAVDAYSKERWSECILQFEGSLHLYKVYKSINNNCRLKCKTENPSHQFSGNIEDLKIFEYFLVMNDCLSQCQKEGFENVHMYSNVSDTILYNLKSRKPYEYLHLCYYEMNILPKAASAAFTYLVAHADDDVMKRNVEYYTQQPEVDIKEVVDLESEDYQVLYKLGTQAYKVNNWGETIANLDETLTGYLTWENSCRAECEHQSEQNWSPEFVITIANNIIPLLKCRQKCQDNLKPLYNSGIEFLADVLNYLQISYYRLDRLDDAAKSVATYLSLLPTDEDMLENKQIYQTLVDKKSFTERSDISSSEINTDKLNIKNILFSKAIPNYTIPVETNGYKIFPCTECGDKFLFESSYNDHINRKSLKITYFCRHCNKIVINKNRCRLLSHIRSHAFKTTTINVSDLKIEPLPIQDINWTLPTPNNSQIEIQKKNKDKNVCYECKVNIVKSDNINADRAAHYMKCSNMVYSCPICLFSLPSACALTAHLRIHLKVPPYFCPECGIYLYARSITYPYYHDCESFNMIRATTRFKCKKTTCHQIYHPNDCREHIKSHLEKVYKCLTCSLMWSNKPTKKHYQCYNNNKIVTCFQCQFCPSKLLFKNEVSKHLNLHFNHCTEQVNELVYPCMSCHLIYHEIPQLIDHQIKKHASIKMKVILLKFLNEYTYMPKLVSQSKFYRVLKKCDKCLRSFLYRCEYENIKILPNECPYKCSSNKNINETNEHLQIVCYLCKNKVNENWDDIKDHFASFHKNHKCLDLKVKLMKIDNKISRTYKNIENLNFIGKNINDSLKKKNIYLRKNGFHIKRRNEMSLNKTIELKDTPINGNVCNVCNFNCQNKLTFESHIISHRDPCMAYQCLECGQCFVVKPSFSTHLLLEHGIADVNKYINKKQCYNESALLKQPNNTESVRENEPVEENQCKICRDQFENSIDLEKHFRMHGMAFLMKNTNKSSSP